MTVDRIGERLRRYRRAAKKTLRQVASESGLTGISIPSLVSIAKSLNIPLNALFDQPTQTQPNSLAGKRVRCTTEGRLLTYERLFSSFPGNQINAVKMSIPVGYRSELIYHEGAELAYVLSGKIAYTIEGRQYPLGAGDSVHFDAIQAHYLANAGNKVAEVLNITIISSFANY